MKDIMLADTPVEQRAQILRDSCDEVVEKSYLSKFSQEETNELRANLVEVQIQIFAGGKTYEAGRKAENNSNGSALDWHR